MTVRPQRRSTVETGSDLIWRPISRATTLLLLSYGDALQKDSVIGIDGYTVHVVPARQSRPEGQRRRAVRPVVDESYR